MANSRDFSNLPKGTVNITAKIIEKYRKNAKLSRKSLSDKLLLIGFDISMNAIYDIEKGTRTVTDYEICAIAKALKLPIQDLLIDYYNSLDEI